MACVDLVARRLGVPASTLFGGAVRDRLPVLLVLGAGDADKDIGQAQEMLDRRLHDRFLVKLGKGDPRDDVARAAAVKRALGDQVRFMPMSIRVGTRLPRPGRLMAGGCRLAVVEQPLPRGDIDGMLRLTEHFAIPIMADEAIDTVERDGLCPSPRGRCLLDQGHQTWRHAPHAGSRLHRGSRGMTLFGSTMLESGVGTAASAGFLDRPGARLGMPVVWSVAICRHHNGGTAGLPRFPSRSARRSRLRHDHR